MQMITTMQSRRSGTGGCVLLLLGKSLVVVSKPGARAPAKAQFKLTPRGTTIVASIAFLMGAGAEAGAGGGAGAGAAVGAGMA